MTRLDAETIARMHELRAQGLSTQEIAKAVYVDRTTVYKYTGRQSHSAHKTHQPTKLGRLRYEAGLTQKQLAEKIGCHHATLGGWERGDAKPRPYWYKRIAAALDCTEEEATKDWREYDETAPNAP